MGLVDDLIDDSGRGAPSVDWRHLGASSLGAILLGWLLGLIHLFEVVVGGIRSAILSGAAFLEELIVTQISFVPDILRIAARADAQIMREFGLLGWPISIIIVGVAAYLAVFAMKISIRMITEAIGL